MNLRRGFQIGSLGLFGILAAGNLLSDRCKKEALEESFSSSLEEQTSFLNERFSYALSAEDLVYLTRILYFEGAFDAHATTEDELRLGYDAIASVIKNRWAFDQEHKSNKFGGKKGLRGVAENDYAFSCVRDNPAYFAEKSFYETKNEFSLIYGQMNFSRTELAYASFVAILSETREDPTDSATFYKTRDIPQVWEGTEAFHVHRKACKRVFTVRINSHEFFEIVCK